MTGHNVDTHEIEKFSQIAHNWWNPEGEFKPLHDINPLRLEYIARHADLAGTDVLDVGCGGGILTEALAKAGAASVLGIDMAEKSLQVAEQHAAAQHLDNIGYRCVSVEDLAAERPQSFDTVTCMEMLEHVPAPESVVRACARLAKPGGTVFFSTLNRNAKSYLHAVLGAEYILNLVPKGTHDWQKFITPAELARMCRHGGLTVADACGMGYKLLTRRYFLGSDTSVNYMIACRKAA